MYEEVTEKARKRVISDLTKGRQVLKSTREEFHARVTAAKSKLGNDPRGVLAGPVKKIRKT